MCGDHGTVTTYIIIWTYEEVFFFLKIIRIKLLSIYEIPMSWKCTINKKQHMLYIIYLNFLWSLIWCAVNEKEKDTKTIWTQFCALILLRIPCIWFVRQNFAATLTFKKEKCFMNYSSAWTRHQSPHSLSAMWMAGDKLECVQSVQQKSSSICFLWALVLTLLSQENLQWWWDYFGFSTEHLLCFTLKRHNNFVTRHLYSMSSWRPKLVVYTIPPEWAHGSPASFGLSAMRIRAGEKM